MAFTVFLTSGGATSGDGVEFGDDDEYSVLGGAALEIRHSDGRRTVHAPTAWDRIEETPRVFAE